MNPTNSILTSTRRTLLHQIHIYWPLIKFLQTSLLIVTGVTGYISAQSESLSLMMLLGLIGSLFLTISGSTVLNMVYDRDIDAVMRRTSGRPIPAGRINPTDALHVGVVLSFIGLAWSFTLSVLYGFVLFAGLFFDVAIYTIWLKRRTPWSIVWGGISGGMPILAGRVLGTGRIDFIGILLALSILLWIPTHIMTFSMRYDSDYRRAGIPTFPSTYGNRHTRWIIAFSSLGAALAMGIGTLALGLAGGYIQFLGILSTGILGLSILSIVRPSEKVNFGLFKYASAYMLGAMILLMLGTLNA